MVKKLSHRVLSMITAVAIAFTLVIGVSGNTITANAAAVSVSLSTPKANINYGENATLNVHITGIDFIWYSDVKNKQIDIIEGNTVVSTGTTDNSSSGNLAISLSNLNVGTHKLKARAVFSQTLFGPIYTYSSEITITVAKATPTITVTANPSSPVYGDSVTLTATLNKANATGTVQFKVGGVPVGTLQTIANGTASISVNKSILTAGNKAISATYSGSSNYNTANGTLAVNVAKATPVMTITKDIENPTYGDSVKFTASIAPVEATGTIEFFIGGVSVGTADATGSITLSKDVLTAGDKTITSKLTSNNSNFNNANGTLDFSVAKATPTIEVTNAPTSAYKGNAISFDVSVKFQNEIVNVGDLSVSNGILTKNLDGTYTVSYMDKNYLGDITFKASVPGLGNFNSNTFDTTVNFTEKEVTNVALSGNNKITYGDVETYTAVVTSTKGQPQGNIIFKVDGTKVATVKVDATGTATFTPSRDVLNALNDGKHEIAAVFNENNMYAKGVDRLAVKVKKKFLNIKGVTATGKTYNENDLTVALVGGKLKTIIDGDVVTLPALQGTVAQGYTVGTGTPVIISDIILGGKDAGNYDVRPLEVTVNVLKADFDLGLLTITPDDKTYDGTTEVKGFKVAFDANVPSEIKDNISSISFNLSFISKDAGETGIIVNKTFFPDSLLEKYNFINSVKTGNATIGKATLMPVFTVTPKTYDGTTDATVLVEFIGGVSFDMPAPAEQGDMTRAMLFNIPKTNAEVPTGTATGTFADADAGIDKPVTVLSVKIDDDWTNNYTLSDYDNITLGTINKAVLMPVFKVTPKTFDGKNDATISVTFTGAISGQIPTGTILGAFLDATAGTDKPVSISSVLLDKAWSLNYILSPEFNKTTKGTITKVEEIIDIGDENIPLSNIPTTIETDKLPLASNPKTNDSNPFTGAIILLIAAAATTRMTLKVKKAK